MGSSLPRRLPATVQDQVNVAFRHLDDNQIRCVLRLTGRLDEARLARAIRLSLDAQPVLGCRFVRRAWRPYWERRADLDQLDLCPVIAAADPQSVEQELWRYVVQTLPPDALLVQAALFQHETSTLCVKLDHTAVDGLGAIQYIALLAQIYRRLAEDPAYRPEPDPGDRGQGQVLRAAGPLALAQSVRHLRISGPGWQYTWAGHSLLERAVAIRRVEQDRLRAIKAYARSHGLSFNTVLIAAYYRALCETVDLAPGHAGMITVLLNLRRYLPEDRHIPIANLSGIDQMRVKREPGAPFDGTAAGVQAVLESMRTTCPGLAMAALLQLAFVPGFAVPDYLLRRFARRAAGSNARVFQPFFSNVGVIAVDPHAFGDVEVSDAFGLGAISFPPGFSLIVSTYRDVMTLSSGFCPAALDPAVVARCLDGILRELPG